MRVFAIALLVVFGVQSTALANPPWLRKAMSDVGTNPTGWSHNGVGVILIWWCLAAGLTRRLRTGLGVSLLRPVQGR